MKPTKLKLIFALTLSVVVLVCARCQNTDKETEEFMKAIEGFDKAWDTYELRDAVAFYADDAMVLLPNLKPFEGIDAIKKHYSTWYEWADSLKSDTPAVKRYKLSVKRDGNIGFEVAKQVSPAGWESKYIHIWEKQPDGSWKIHADMVSPSQPPREE